MINVSPFIQRLEWLKEWLGKRIDGEISPPIWVNVDALPHKFDYSVDAVMKIFNECGVLYIRNEIVHHPMCPFSFEEYCNYKQSLLKNK